MHTTLAALANAVNPTTQDVSKSVHAAKNAFLLQIPAVSDRKYGKCLKSRSFFYTSGNKSFVGRD